MKITIEFDTEVDGERHEMFMQAEDLFIALHEFKTELRHIWRYEEHSDEVAEMVDRICGMFQVAISDNNIDKYF